MRNKTSTDAMLVAAASIITAIVTVHAVTSRHMSITATDFVLFMLITAGALFIMRTLIRLFDDLIRHLRRGNR